MKVDDDKKLEILTAMAMAMMVCRCENLEIWWQGSSEEWMEADIERCISFISEASNTNQRMMVMAAKS